MVAIVGKICVGKSRILKLLFNKGYHVLEVDHFVTLLYKDINFVKKVKNLVKYDLVTKNSLDKQKIKTWILLDIHNLQILENLINIELYIHLQNHNYDFVEYPILFKAPKEIMTLFSEVWHVQIPEIKRKSFLNKKYGKTDLIKKLDTLNTYNWQNKELFNNLKVVDISWEKALVYPKK